MRRCFQPTEHDNVIFGSLKLGVWGAYIATSSQQAASYARPECNGHDHEASSVRSPSSVTVCSHAPPAGQQFCRLQCRGAAGAWGASVSLQAIRGSQALLLRQGKARSCGMCIAAGKDGPCPPLLNGRARGGKGPGGFTIMRAAPNIYKAVSEQLSKADAGKSTLARPLRQAFRAAVLGGCPCAREFMVFLANFGRSQAVLCVGMVLAARHLAFSVTILVHRFTNKEHA